MGNCSDLLCLFVFCTLFQSKVRSNWVTYGAADYKDCSSLYICWPAATTHVHLKIKTSIYYRNRKFKFLAWIQKRHWFNTTNDQSLKNMSFSRELFSLIIFMKLNFSKLLVVHSFFIKTNCIIPIFHLWYWHWPPRQKKVRKYSSEIHLYNVFQSIHYLFI